MNLSRRFWGRARLTGWVGGVAWWPATAWAADWSAPVWVNQWPGAAAASGLVAIATYTFLHERHRRRERAFAVSATRLQFLFDSAPVGILVTDMRTQVAWLEALRGEGVKDIQAYMQANPERLREQFNNVALVAINRTALGGVHDSKSVRATARRFAPDFGAPFLAEMVALWEGRRELVHDVVFRREDGQIAHAVMQWSVPMDGEKPDYARVMSVFADVTDLRRTQERLRRSEDRWQLAVQGINAGVWENDYETERVFVSERSREMLGYAAGDLEDSHAGWEALIHPEDRAAAARGLEQHLARRTTAYRVEHRLLCRDGRYRWILTCGLAQFDAQGKAVRIVGTHSDIHARKTAEEDLAGERERLRVTLRAMVEAVITADRNGVVNFLNEAAEQLTGWAEGVAIGRTLAEVCPLQHERSREAVESPHKRALAEALVVEVPPASVLVHRQGVRRLVEGRCAPIRDIASQPAGVVLVLRDVTERAKMEAEMLRATKLESVGVLAGGIAHDFNNLLTVVMGNVTLAMLDSQTLASSGQWLGEAEKGLMRARDLTQQLLTFAKGGEPIRSTVQLAEVVRETTKFSLHGSKVKPEFEIEPQLWTAEVDKGQIGQVVQNLVINAAQAMADGGVVRINLSNDGAPPVRTGLTGAAVRLSVHDTGVGIRTEHLGKIFDPYFTTKTDGSGLGLATVYAIIKKHGGYIEVESEVGRGTRFRMWLPAARTEGPSKSLTTSPFGMAVGTGAMNGRVLLMDDEAGIREMASQLLIRIGFDVDTAADGAAAVEAYGAALKDGRRFDLVVMDLTVPGGMGGLAAMKRMRELDPKVRAIVSSGYSSDPVMSDFRAYGFSGMIPKPYRITDFAMVIRQVLEAAG